MRGLAVLALAIGLSGCAMPKSEEINGFANGLNATASSFEASLIDTNNLSREEELLQAARNYAISGKDFDGGDGVVDLIPGDPPITLEMITFRKKSIGTLQAYAKLLVALSDGSLTNAFAAQMEAVGKQVVNLQAKASLVVPGTSEADLGPVLKALNIIGQQLIRAKAARAINDVAPKVHPVLIDIVTGLKKDVFAVSVIKEGRAIKIAEHLGDVLEAVPGRSRDPIGRYNAYRDFYAASSNYLARAKGDEAIAGALDKLVAAHKAVFEPGEQDNLVALSEFLMLADAAADFYVANLKEK